MDVDSIGLGADFVKTIQDTVGSCDVLIAVIGSRWLTCTDAQGARRLDNAEDFVRTEIAAALRRDIRVIPVLVDGALMPRSADLPDDLKQLVRRNALEVGDTHFDDDCRRLIAAIEQVLEETKRERGERKEKERLEAECHETEAKEILEAEAGRKASGKRKLRLSAGTMISLALVIGLVAVTAVYFGFRRPESVPNTPGAATQPSAVPTVPVRGLSPSPTMVATATWATRFGMTASKYQQMSDELKGQGYRLTNVSGYNLGGQAAYAAIWVKSSGPPWEGQYGLTSAQFQQAFEDLRKRGYRPVRVSGYGIEGQAFYAGIWE